MDPKRETTRILKALDEARKGRGWGGAGWLDRKLGSSPGYISRVMSGKISLRLEQFFEILNILEFEAGEFFAGVFGTRYRFRPERYLEVLERKQQKTEVLRRIDRVIDASILTAVDESRPSLPEVDDEFSADLSRLEEFRFTDPAAARVEAIDSLTTITKLAESGPIGILPTICDAVSLVGAIEIAQRNYSSAAAYLSRALRIARKEGYSLKEAKILQRCSYLIATQGEYEVALNFSAQALDIYVLFGDMPGVGKCLVDQGMMLRRSHRPQEAIQRYEAAQRYLPKERWQYRFSLYQSLGFAYLECGEVAKAENCAEMAAKEHKTRDGINWSKIFWLYGEIYLKKDQLDSAEGAFRKVEEATKTQGNCIDLALVNLRLALILLKTGRMQEMLDLVSQMVRLLEPLKSENKVAAKAMNDLIH